MYIEVKYNLSQGCVKQINEMRLTKKIKNEIKERMIDELEYKDLSDIIKIRGAEIKRVSASELERRYKTNNINDYIEYLDIEK